MNALVPTDLRLLTRPSPVERVDAAVESASDLELALWLVVVWTLVLDVALTVHGLSVGLAERNPVIQPAIHAVGPVALVLAKGAAVAVALALRAAFPRCALVVPLGLAIPWGLAALYNAVLLASL